MKKAICNFMPLAPSRADSLEREINFDRAIRDHLLWKDRLRHIITETAWDRRKVCADLDGNHCELGAWLQMRERSLRSLNAYRKLVETHAQFHRIAGLVVAKVNTHDVRDADDTLEGAFVLATVDMVRAIINFKDELTQCR